MGMIRSPELAAEQPPLAYPTAARALVGCVVGTARLLRRHRLHLPKERVGMRLRFADGTSARVFRETTADRDATVDPCVLVVEFRLRAVRGHRHAAFRRESLLSTPLFAGFPGFRSKLWLADDERGRYRGLYEWDGPQPAANYARALQALLDRSDLKPAVDLQLPARGRGPGAARAIRSPGPGRRPAGAA